jgi:hypothetical protein
VFIPILITSIRPHNVDRGAPSREKRLRSVRKDHGTLDVRRQVSSRHSAHLRVIDFCHRGRWRPEDAAPRVGTRAPGSGFIISIRRFLFRFRSLCRDLHLHHQDCSGYPSSDIHPPVLDRGIEFVFISIDPWSKFIWRLTWDRGQRLWWAPGRRSPYLHGGPEWWSVTQQL